MALTIPPATVVAPDRAPLPYGLFTHLTPRPSSDPHWQVGVQWETEGCDSVTTTVADCDPTELDLITADGDGVLGEADALTIVGLFKCSPAGFSPATANDRALAQLLRGEERAVENALWSGVTGFPSVLTGSHTVQSGTGTVSVKEGLARLEWEIAQSGSQGIIHVGTALGTYLALEGYIEARQGRMTTKLGTPVIVGSGYDSGSTFPAVPFPMVATGPGLVYRSETFGASDGAGDLLDRDRNDLYGTAYRTYVVGFDTCMPITYVNTDPGLALAATS